MELINNQRNQRNIEGGTDRAKEKEPNDLVFKDGKGAWGHCQGLE